MWQRQTHATISGRGHFSSVYDLAWPKSSKDRSDMLSSIYSVGLVEGTASCFDLWIKITQFWKSSLSPVLMSGHAALSRSKVRSKSLWPSSTCSKPCQHKANYIVTFFLPVLCRRLMFELHMHKALERRIGQLFVWQLSIETFHVQCQQFKIKLINPRHSSLNHKAAKILWSCSHTEVVSLSDLNIKYKWQLIISIWLQMFFKSSGSKWSKWYGTDGNQQNLCFCLQIQ